MEDLQKQLGSGHPNGHYRQLAHIELDKILDVFDDIRRTYGRVAIEISVHDGYFKQVESSVRNVHK